MPIEALFARAIYCLGERAPFLLVVGTQMGERVLGNPLLAGQFIQPGEGRACRHEMRLRVFPLERALPFEAEQPDDGPQAQPLADQRHQDDPEGEEDHQAALRERHAIRERQG